MPRVMQVVPRPKPTMSTHCAGSEAETSAKASTEAEHKEDEAHESAAGDR